MYGSEVIEISGINPTALSTLYWRKIKTFSELFDQTFYFVNNLCIHRDFPHEYYIIIN